MSNDKGCKHEIWPASACLDCHPRQDTPARTQHQTERVSHTDVVARFTARWTGEECEWCDGTLVEGTPICRLVDGGYAHEACTESWPTARWSL